MKYPCLNCEKRFVGCHSTCKEYLEAKASDYRLTEEYIQAKREDRENMEHVCRTIYRRERRTNRRR